MSKVSAEMPSKAQQSALGTDSTKPCAGGLATAGGVVRMTGAVATLAGCTPNLTVALIGESAILAVSFRGPVGAMLRPPGGWLTRGRNGRGGAGGFRPEGGVVAGGPEDGGAPEGLRPLGGDGASGGLAPGGGGGRTAPAGTIGAGGALEGGRAGGVPPAGGAGFRAPAGGGGRIEPADGGRILGGGGFAPTGGSGGCGRLGKLIRVVSFSTGTVGRFVVRGGKVMRTVSFFGSFRSAITL